MDLIALFHYYYKMKYLRSLLLFIPILSFAQKEPVDLVYPLVDAANSRWFFFNSASRPFGMVNLSPDNAINADWGAGYRYNLDSIKCFSHIHGWQLSGVPVLPTTGKLKDLNPNNYGSKFSHDTEIIKPGYHKVYLESYDITAELTSTTRVGFHKYTFPKNKESSILFDFSTFLGPSDTDYGYIKKVSAREIEGHAIMGVTRRRPKPLTVYFVAQFDQAFQSETAWSKNKVILLIDNVIEGKDIGLSLGFETTVNEIRKMKVGISYVSSEQARNNIREELPHWDFEKCVSDSRIDCNTWLSKIEV